MIVVDVCAVLCISKELPIAMIETALWVFCLLSLAVLRTGARDGDNRRSSLKRCSV